MPVLYGTNRTFEKTVSNDANGNDTVRLIVNTINTYSHSDFVKKTVEILKQGNPTPLEFLKRLFAVACKNVKYLADEPGHEIVYTPLLLMKMGKGDCKKFTVFIASVLKAAGFNPITKVVKYAPGNDWEHIYVIVPFGNSYITMDPVNKEQFNKEVDYYEGRENYLNGTYSPIMKGNKLSQMGNLGTNSTESSMMGGIHKAADNVLADMDGLGFFNNENRNRRDSRFHAPSLREHAESYMNGLNDENLISGNEGEGKIGKRAKKTKEEKKEKRKKIFHVLAKTNPAFIPVRVSFLTLVKIGGALQKIKGMHINLAAKLAQAMQNPETAKPILKIWHQFGGEDKVLLKAIAQAGKSSLHGPNSLTSGIYGPELAIPAAITAASPILIVVIKAMKKSGQIKPGEAEGIENAVQTAQDVAVTTQDGKFTPESLQALTTSPLIQETSKEDAGGHAATTQDIATEAAKPDPSFLKETDQSSPAVSDNIRTAAKTQPELLPTVTDQSSQPTGKSSLSSIMLPTVWIRISFLILIFSNYLTIQKQFINCLTTIAISGLVATFIYIFTKKNQ